MPEYTANGKDRVDARERMLTELLSAVRARRRRRAAVRLAGGVLAVVVAGLVARGYSGPASAPVREVAAADAVKPEAGEAVAMRVEFVENSGDILSRTAARPVRIVEVMDDASLMATLMPTCGNVGLARIGDEVRVFGDCPELAPPTAAQ